MLAVETLNIFRDCLIYLTVFLSFRLRARKMCFIYFRETTISFERLYCFFAKLKRIGIDFEFKLLILQHPRGEILGSRMRFLLYPV